MQHKAGTRGAHSANGRAGAPTRTAMSDRPRTPQRAWQRESGVARRHRVVPTALRRLFCDHRHARVQTCYCSRSYTHKVRLRRPWNGDWRSFFVLKSVDSLPLEARWSWQLPTGAESPLPTVTAGWLRCPPAEPQRRGLSDYSPIHTPIFSSPPVLAHAYCRTPNALLGTPNPLLLWRHSELHAVRLVALAEREARLEVLVHQRHLMSEAGNEGLGEGGSQCGDQKAIRAAGPLPT